MAKTNPESFLDKEYDQCFEHMRHYENLTKDLLQFSYGYYTAIAALSIGIYQYFHETHSDSAASFGYTAILLILSVVIGTIITTQFVRYRKYYVNTARQVNRIRKYYIENLEKFNSALPTDPDIPKAYNPKSTQLRTIYIFIIVNAIYLYIGLYCLLRCMHIFKILSSYLAFILLAVYVVVLWLQTIKILKKS
jgi:hypothetical protein